MTVIVGLHQDGETWIGSDSCVVDANGLKCEAGSKIVGWGQWRAGIAGEFTTMSMVRAHAKQLFDDLEGAWTFGLRLRDLFTQYEVKPKDEHGWANFGHRILLAHPTTLWEIDGTFGVIEVPEGILWAAGSGYAFAMGAGYVNGGLSAYDRVYQALAAACCYGNGCGGQIWIEKVVTDGPA